MCPFFHGKIRNVLCRYIIRYRNPEKKTVFHHTQKEDEKEEVCMAKRKMVKPVKRSMSLKKALQEIKAGEVLFVGAKSSYFFIGVKEEFIRNIDRVSVDLMMDTCATQKEREKFVPIRERKVVDIYSRFQGDGTVLILEGKEQGQYWFLEEYRRLKGAAPEKEDGAGCGKLPHLNSCILPAVQGT